MKQHNIFGGIDETDCEPVNKPKDLFTVSEIHNKLWIIYQDIFLFTGLGEKFDEEINKHFKKK